MSEHKPPWWAGGKVIAHRDVGWDLSAGEARVVIVRYDLRTGRLYAAIVIQPEEELRMLEHND